VGLIPDQPKDFLVVHQCLLSQTARHEQDVHRSRLGGRRIGGENDTFTSRTGSFVLAITCTVTSGMREKTSNEAVKAM